MAKFKVNGLKKAEGKQGFDPLVPGEYVVQINKPPVVAPSEKSSGDNWKFDLTVLDGPEQADGSAPDGRMLFENVFIMGEDHPSYSQWGHIGVEQLKAIVNATGVDVTSSDNVDPEDFVGKAASVKVKTEPPQRKGDDPRSVIKKWEALEDE